MSNFKENIKACAAFVKAQADFAPALKQSNNPHFKSKYADLAGCIEAVIDALNKNGLSLLQYNHDREGGIAIETILMHESGEYFSGGIMFIPVAKNDAQGYGSALTYARRYSLMATCGIAPEDDDGNSATDNKPKADKKLTEDQILEIEGKIKDVGADRARFFSFLGIKDLKDVNFSYFDKIMENLDLKRKSAQEPKTQKDPMQPEITEIKLDDI